MTATVARVVKLLLVACGVSLLIIGVAAWRGVYEA